MSELLISFIEEAKSLTKTIIDGLISIEKSNDKETLLEEIFRAMHTLKGSSGLFDIPDFTNLSHLAEDLLDNFRNDRSTISENEIDFLLSVSDILIDWIDQLSEKGSIFDHFPERVKALQHQSKCFTSFTKVETDDSAQSIKSDNSDQTFQVTYIPNENCFFSGEDPLHVWRTAPNLRTSKISLTLSEEIDFFKCALSFYGTSDVNHTEIHKHFEYYADDVSISEINSFGGPDIAFLLQLAEEQLKLYELFSVEKPDQIDSIISSVCTLWNNVCNSAKLKSSIADRKTVIGKIAEFISVSDKGFNTNSCDAPKLEGRVSAAPPQESERTAPTVRSVNSSSFVRVEESRLDNLMNLIGELVVAKNALPFLAHRAENEFGSPGLSREILSQYSVSDRLAHEMQGAILQLRMTAVSNVFDRFPRLVREVSKKLGKRVDLRIEGGETEIDKAIVETLSDPMIHLVRNALDHGIEPPEERQSLGKAETATIKLAARSEADQIIIEVSDDGRGINPEIIREKAFSKGIISESERSNISDDEALNLIFRSGFSTNSEVSDLSGRGVGMDVVLTSIRESGGSVGIRSELSRGTTITLSLPLSMAISRLVIVKVCDAIYGIPMDLIFEMCRVSRNEIRYLRGNETAVLRGQVIPLIRLRQLFTGTPAKSRDEDRDHELVVVVTCGNEMLGFIVDDLHERMETIVKPMDGVLSGLRGFTGTALMGDGRVLLVINPEGISRGYLH